ncbi:MAG: DUF2145 domain-containing protein [Acidiferrobacterales bacterium]|nr:DUF2145 domain-containing protein [Acidiferrobacterales bacterium]
MIRLLIILIACLGFAQAGHAGGGSQRNLPAQFKAEDIASFSKQVEKTLASKRAIVALVARNGRPPKNLPEGVRYTHVGFAVYSEIQLEDGNSQRGYAFHNLYQLPEQPDRSEIVVDFAMDFFAGASEMKAGILIPTPALQKRLYEAIVNNGYHEFHNPRYSAISNPFDTRYQNCTEFVMNVTQSAIHQTSSLAEIKANLQQSFDPFVLPYSKTLLNLASMGSQDISMKDHGYPVVTTTFTSIADYLKKHKLVSEVIELSNLTAVPIKIGRNFGRSSNEVELLDVR